MIIFIIFILGVISLSVSADESDFNFEQLENPATITDLLAKFSKFKYSMTEKENEDLKRKNTITFSHQGKENVEGTETDKVTIRGTGTNEIPFTQIWFNQEKVVKLIIEDQELPPAMAQGFIDEILSSALTPFMYLKEYSLEDAAEFKKTNVKKRNRVLAGKEIQVIEYDMEKLDEYGLKSGVISIAEFDDFLILENYNVVTVNDIGINYRLEAVEF